MKVRVRFAPSPTGHLHLGGFRTALLNFLFARKNNGTFILRVEDTDQTRTIPGAADQLEDDLNWLQLKPDESPRQGGNYGPYTQSQRLDLYHSYIQKLIDSSAAYECFCTEKRLELIRKEAVRIKATPGYDNKCRNLTRSEVVQKKANGERHVIRLKLNPEPVQFNDMLHGKVELSNHNDPVIIKGDGFPTYHYANIIDDHLMEISHVLRGVEWQISTGIHFQLYRAFGWQPPQFAHLPVLLNPDGTKLSKRQADMSIQSYREQGLEAICLTNFVTKSGGGFYHHVDKIFSMQELVEQFDLSKLNTNSCKLDFNFLTELNRVHLREKIENYSDEVLSILKAKHPAVDDGYLTRVLHWAKPRITSLNELESMNFLWSHPADFKIKTSRESLIDFKNYQDMYKLKDFTQAHGLNTQVFLKDLRYILCGLNEGPPIVELFDLLGPELVKTRLERAIQNIK